ncbi:DUF2267 domain-containing protein [Streptomyces sp. NPDC046832]|uniref:DUF2267 domain-containing protein n=1 Tax=Streptomyces sp. NPDC046832 TaxID=3155020 RepID=UPI0034045640
MACLTGAQRGRGRGPGRRGRLAGVRAVRHNTAAKLEARDLITELPEGLAEAVRRGTTDRIERFGHHDSVRRVAERTMLKEEEADRGVRAVLVVLREAISEKEFDDLMSQLGTDFSQHLESAG